MASQQKIFAKQLAAEFLGTFFIIYFATYLVPNTEDDQEKKKLEKEHLVLSHALNIFFMVSSISWVFLKVSGSHFHSGISIGAFFLNKISSTQLLGYLLAQAVGVLSADALLFITGTKQVGTDEAPLPLQFFELEWSWYMIIFWETIITLLVTFVYFVLAYNPKAERGILSVVMGGIYATFILSMMNCYYSRYNFTWALMSSLSSFQIDLRQLWILIGGIIGTISGIVLFNLTDKQDIEKEANDYLMQEEGEFQQIVYK